ncbi:hypothetical protein AB4305_24380 [Nocardia sp. 2YAB30]|uniref:hypothetical protein n=1 Tax=Nocardia sp. 2YAB30 TaxID=3233022 RepID=UPI003F9B8876
MLSPFGRLFISYGDAAVGVAVQIIGHWCRHDHHLSCVTARVHRIYRTPSTATAPITVTTG